MTIEQLELRLEKWKRYVWFSLGASAYMLLSAAVDALLVLRQPDPNRSVPRLIVWILIECAVVSPAVLLTLGREWRKMPITLRLNTIFGSLAASCMAIVPFGWRLQLMINFPGDIPLLLLIVGVLLAGMFFYLRNKLETASESMFP